ncbi:helix-turn-helix domain-containing protein [Pontibacter toksunensis]|uniref:Helix-turn-helix domain-containing protein n=1 Tax=Pontibacter toksunensis TaxID=1332631 RepID=A0ABW6BVS0_9BACT
MTENPFTVIEKRIERLESILLRIEEQLDQTDKQQFTGSLMTIKEASAFLNLSSATIYSKTRNREIPHSKRGKRLYFSQKELADWVREGYQRTQAEIETDASVFMRVSRRRAS